MNSTPVPSGLSMEDLVNQVVSHYHNLEDARSGRKFTYAAEAVRNQLERIAESQLSPRNGHSRIRGGSTRRRVSPLEHELIIGLASQGLSMKAVAIVLQRCYETLEKHWPKPPQGALPTEPVA